MIGWGEIFSVLAALTWALSVIMLRRSGETLPALPLNLFKHLLSFTLLAPTILLFSGTGWPDYTRSELGILLLSGFLGIAMADTLYLRALNLLGAARTGIVGSMYSPMVIILSMMFLGEAMNVLQWAGFLLVMSGVLLVTWRRHKREVSEPDLLRGVAAGVASVVLMAVAIVMAKGILETRPFLWTVEVRMIGGIAGMLAIVTLRRQWPKIRADYRRQQPWGLIVAGSFTGAYLSMMLWLAGYSLTQASVAAVLNESATAFIVLFAWLLLREPVPSRRLFGLVLTMAGVMLMLLA